MSDWVHCNSCFRQPGDGKKYSITNCGHIYCENCVGSGTQPKCKMCGSKCCTTVLSPKMKPDVDIFFWDPVDIVKKQHDQLMKVLEFQRNQRQRLILYTKDKMMKQGSMIQKAQKAMEHLQKLTQENVILKAENAYLRKNSGGRTPPLSSHGRSGGARDKQTPSPKSSPYNNTRHLAESMYRQMASSNNLGQGRLTVKNPPAGSRTSPCMQRTPGASPNNYSMDFSPAYVAGKLSSHQNSMYLPITPGQQQKTPSTTQIKQSPHGNTTATPSSSSTAPGPTGMLHRPHSATVLQSGRYTPSSYSSHGGTLIASISQ